jgi:hypothetical protein
VFLLMLPMRVNAQTTLPAGPLKAAEHPNYFKDAHGAVLILSGSLVHSPRERGIDGPIDRSKFSFYY